MTKTTQLTTSECAAIEHYVWQHCRAYPQSAAYRAWMKLYGCAYGERPDAPPVAEPEMPLFENSATRS